MHPAIARKMKITSIPLILMMGIGAAIFFSGLLVKGWWLYFGMVIFMLPIPFLLALLQIFLLSKKGP